MNEPTAYGRPAGHERAAVEVHIPTPLAPAHTTPLGPMQPGAIPAVTSVVLPDGRVVTGYTLNPVHPEPVVTTPPAVSRAAVNVALGGVGFLAVCGGLLLLTTFIAALTALVTQLVILAAVIFGGWIAVQVFGASGPRGGTTVNIRKAVIKRNRFYG
ncbi:hypothetical protein [Streptomyces sp. SID12501]|uniref:Uncharacterized protein n=1 Tax=Streptomyces sp. SID12501 TaxID=2706042 RepID=A0A6B3BQM4_9ACTN|nr:hypothetical protein [Streptomyces sp. SID12501]NEC86628.1 hypothetical protein [Streptomyces sp. SID12501]